MLASLRWAVLVCCVVAVGCSTANRPPVATTTSAAPSLSPQDQAREAMDYFGLPLPTHTQQLDVAAPPLAEYDEFRAKAVVSFVAPRQEVMDQTCRNVKYKDFDHSPLLAGMDEPMLKDAGITLNRADYVSCGEYEGGRNIDVLIPRVEGGTTYVVLYHMPYR